MHVVILDVFGFSFFTCRLVAIDSICKSLLASLLHQRVMEMNIPLLTNKEVKVGAINHTSVGV